MTFGVRLATFVRAAGRPFVVAAVAGALLVGCSRAERSGFTTLTDVPRFKEFEGKTYFTVSDGEDDYEVWWSYWRQPEPPRYPSNFSNLVLQAGEQYRFTFAADDNTAGSADFHATISRVGEERARRDIPLSEWRSAKLIKIEQGPRVLFDQDFCPVHQRRMSVAYAPVSYGLIVVDEEVATAFPHHGRWVLGGCVGGPDTRRPVLVCGRCRDRFRAFDRASRAAGTRLVTQR